MGRKDNFIPVSTGRGLQALELPDCVHLTERCGCDILKVPRCTGKSCSFCQTRQQRSAGSSRWLARINGLSAAQQDKISAVYYGGCKPWKGPERKG